MFIIGPSVSRSPNQSSILRKISEFSSSIDANIGFLTEFCNSTSGWLLGNLPHRELGGGKPRQIGKNSYEMIKSHLSSYIFYNLEPEFDFFNKQDLEHALDTSKCNIFFTSYITPIIEKYADIIIPITTFAETDGGYINIEGTYQTFQPIVQPSKNIHVGWSTLNDILKLNNLGDYSIDEIRGELAESLDGLDFSTPVSDMSDINSNNGTIRAAAERNAINMPIQGTAADMIKIAMVRVQNSISEAGLESRMLLQVHDELVFDLHPEEEEELRKIVTEGMVGALELACPIEVEVGIGENWLEAH